MHSSSSAFKRLLGRSSTVFRPTTKRLGVRWAWGRLTCLPGNDLMENKVGAPVDVSSVTLYQYNTCPFCTKVRAFLDYNEIRYHSTEVNPMSKEQIQWLNKDLFPNRKPQVPIIALGHRKVGPQYVIESSHIVKTLHTEFLECADGPMTETELQWMKFVDDEIIQYITPIIYDSLMNSYRAFDYVNSVRQEIPVWTKHMGAVAMWLVGRAKSKKFTDPLAELIVVCHERWVAEALNSKPFCGGSKPNAGDLSLYGVLAALVRCRPDLHDSIVLEEGDFSAWFWKMKMLMEQKERENYRRWWDADPFFQEERPGEYKVLRGAERYTWRSKT